MAKQPKNAAASQAAANATPATPAAPPAAVSPGAATEATASSNGASETDTVAGDHAPAGVGQADLSEASVAAAREALLAARQQSGEPLVIGVDLASGPDQTALIVQTPGAVFYFDELAAVLDLGDGESLTLGEFFDLPQGQQADVLLMLVDAATQARRPITLPTSEELIDDLAAIREPAPKGFVWVQGKSRDGKPFRRAGIVWDDNFTRHLVTEAAAFVIAKDRHLTVKFL